MPNSSSSKYVKRRAHRRTKSRRHAKKYTIKKVMRGCNSKQYGGAQVPLGSSPASGSNKVEIPTSPKSTPEQTEAHAQSADNLLKLQQLAGPPPEAYTPTVPINTTTSATTSATTGGPTQKGGYKSKHRRRRYKKSIGRKGRSRRFRGSRK